MRVSHVISTLTSKVQEILDALDNRLTAEDNFGPEGEKWQVLTSRGPKVTDPPPTYMTLEDILTGISSEGAQGLQGLKGETGATGASGEPRVLLRGASWSNGGLAVDLLGQRFGVTPEAQADGTITACRIVGRGVGSATFGVKQTSTYPAGLVDITGGADAVIVTASIIDVSLTGWSTSVLQGDVFEFELKSVTGFTQVEIFLEITPN